MSQSPNLLAADATRAASQHGERRLAAIVAAAAPFGDRAGGALFEAREDGAGDVRDRVAAWLAEAAADPATLRAVVARRAATGQEIGAGLRDVCLRDGTVLPDWAQALAEFLAAQAPDRDADAASHEPGGIFEAFRRGAAGMLPGDGVIEGIALSADARDDVARALGVRLWYACEPAIAFELRLNDEPADDVAGAVVDVSAEGWLRRLELLPGLAYVVGLTCRQWRASIVELFGRLRDDLPALRASMWNGAQPGTVTSVSADAGDRHHDGRAVALLGFASGCGVVYKPKDQRHALAFMQTVAFLNERLALKLHTRAILACGDYGWEERAVSGPCADEQGFARYYRRLGMLVRLVQLLEGRDMWADNLLAVGDQPVLTDLECLLYPRVTPPPTLPGALRELLDVFEETVVRTGLVIQPWVPRPSIPLRDLGCLSHAGDPLEDAPSLPLPPYRPWTEAGLADPWRHGDDILAGYRDMQAALVASRDELRAPDGPLALFEGALVRYIWRHTWECQNILRASTSPRALISGADREIVLARVLRDAYGMQRDHAERLDLCDIAEAELDGFRDLDVPLFRSRTTSRSAFTVDGEEIAEHFHGTAWQRLQRRLDELAEFPVDEHVAVVTACLEGVRNAAELTAPVARAGGRSPLRDQRVLGVACEAADAILAARVSAGDSTGWLGLSWYPVPDLYQIEVAGGDLLTGTAAIGVFLAELAARTGRPAYWSAAYDVVDGLADFLGASSRFTTDLRLAGGVPVPGGLAGPGAGVYAFARCAPLLGDPALLDTARALALSAAAAARSDAVLADAPLGSAGLLLNLMRLRVATGGDADIDALVRERISHAAAALVDPAARFGSYAPTSRLADFVPVGRDSVAMTLSRALANVPQLVDDADAVRAALAAHRYDLSRRGGRLAMLAGATDVAPDPRALAALESATPSAMSCRELVATGGEALVAGRTDDAEQLLRALVARRDHDGSWFGDRWIDDRLNLSAVDGLVAVGMLALGVLDAGLPSLTLLG
jgi:hypothetical protein